MKRNRNSTIKLRTASRVITLNDPPANTYSYEMMQQLDRAILDARMDDAVQVIVITGKGEKFFCAGADIQMLADVTPTFKYYFCLHANETLCAFGTNTETRDCRDQWTLRRWWFGSRDGGGHSHRAQRTRAS